MTALDPAVRSLVRLSAIIASGTEEEVRIALGECLAVAEPSQVDEVILQSYLFCGLPRALNAARDWRRISGIVAPEVDSGTPPPELRREVGEATCARVYGDAYHRLRENIRALHPALDDWMILEGYGKVLARQGLALPVRELCVLAACAASRQERQLHSHLHGALNAGATAAEVDAAIEALEGTVDPTWMPRVLNLWKRVKRKTEE